MTTTEQDRAIMKDNLAPLERITDDDLRAYARLLINSGFTVYVSKRVGFGTYFLYSRIVDGRTLWGSVELSRFEGYRHYMPIKPSREHGSSMFVPDADKMDPLSLEAALLITRPTNYNSIVGTHDNMRTAHDRETFISRGFDRIEPIEEVK